MAKGLQTFADVLQEIMRLLGTAKMTPDADLAWLAELESQIIEHAQNPEMSPQGVSMAGTQPGFSAQQMAGGPGAAPMPTMEAPTRLPQKSPDMSGAIAALGRSAP